MRKIWKDCICFLLVMVCFWGVLPKGQAAVQELPHELFLTQEGSGTCTLCAATMVIRSVMYTHGNEDWRHVTQSSLQNAAWISGVGLKWSFTYHTGSCTVQMAHQSVNGMSATALKNLLAQHPEGIVLYCKDVPHGVFLMGYEGDRFYCAETVQGYSGKKILLEESWLGTKLGSLEGILKKVSAYWYVASYEETAGNQCFCHTEYAGDYRVNIDSGNLRIRSGHGTNYSVVGSMPAGAAVTVSKASGSSNGDWAHVTYNGISGYASMEYLTKAAWKGTVTATSLRIRSGPGTGNGILGYLPKGARVEIFEMKTVSGMTWGRITQGWISLDYVTLEQSANSTRIVTVDADCLRIRSGAGVSNKIVDYLYRGAKVEILGETVVNGIPWGKTSQGWISLEYVK